MQARDNLQLAVH